MATSKTRNQFEMIIDQSDQSLISIQGLEITYLEMPPKRARSDGPTTRRPRKLPMIGKTSRPGAIRRNIGVAPQPNPIEEPEGEKETENESMEEAQEDEEEEEEEEEEASRVREIAMSESQSDGSDLTKKTGESTGASSSHNQSTRTTNTTDTGTTAVEKVKNQENELTKVQESELGGPWMSRLFHVHKFLTDAMMRSPLIGGQIVKAAYRRLEIHSTEQKKKKYKAVVRVIKKRFNRCKDYFVDSIKRAVMDEKGKGNFGVNHILEETANQV